MKEWSVTKETAGTKLVAFLKQQLGEAYSSRQLKRAIEQNLCLVNGHPERFASYSLRIHDRIEFNPEKLAAPPKLARDAILFEDDYLLLYNKPAGVTCDENGILQAFPHAQIVHRLDRDTTGVLVLARTDEAREAMENLFLQHNIQKTYLALVDGVPPITEGTIENFLAKKHSYEGQTIWGCAKRGHRAVTNWQLKEKGPHASLIQCMPETGRMHQIRVHMSEMGHPILGDYQYGWKKFTCSYRPQRHLLHAHKLSFEHPITKRTIQVTAPIPTDFQEAMNEVLS